MSDLLELAARCEAATGPDREIDIAISETLGLVPKGYVRAVIWDKPHPYFWSEEDQRAAYWSPEKFTASLDAAMTLVPEGFNWALGSTDEGGHATVSKMPEDDEAYSGGRLPAPEIMTFGYAATPALALTAACLRARASVTPTGNPSSGTTAPHNNPGLGVAGEGDRP